MKVCKEPNCSRPVHARGMCNGHYGKWRRVTSVARTFNDGYGKIVLAALPGTVQEAAVKAAVHEVTAAKWITAYHGTKVYICDWKKVKHASVAIYSRGNLPDVPCTLEKKPRDQVQRDYRARRRAREASRPKLPKATWLSALGVPP